MNVVRNIEKSGPLFSDTATFVPDYLMGKP